MGDRIEATIGQGTVYLPADPTGEVEVQANHGSEAPGFRLGLPILNGRGEAEIAADGTVVYSSTKNVSVAVQVDDWGFRTLTVLHDQSAPDRFAYQVMPPEGATLDQDGGGAWILDSAGEPYAYLEPAWALDAHGQSVPTWYEIEADHIVQVVNHNKGIFVYPIVADPSWLWWVGTSLACAAELASIAFGAAKVIKAFAQSEKIIQASKTMISAYKTLGNSMSKVIELVKKYIKNKTSLTKAQINALETLSKSVLSVAFNIIGLGSCYNMVVRG